MQNLIPITLKKTQPKGLKPTPEDGANFQAKSINQMLSHLEETLTLRKTLVEAVVLSKVLI